MNQPLAELISSIIEDAGYYIGYWASEGTHSTEARSYELKHEGEDGEPTTTTISYDDIWRAIVKIAEGNGVNVNQCTRNICTSIVRLDSTKGDEDDADIIQELADLLDEIDYDAEDADVIIQVAIFGKIVFG